MNFFDEVDPQTRAEFNAYHKANPDIFKMFFEFASEILRTGRKQYSAKTIMERIRWEKDLKNSKEDFKINNNYTAYYARGLMQRYPEFIGFFEIRQTKGLKDSQETDIQERKDIYG